MNNKKHFLTTYELIISALFIALITVGAFIKIPVGPVPITLQFMFVLLAGQNLNAKCAAITMLIYVILGLFGLPVFSGGGGPGYVLTPTFGYIIGFVFAVMVVSVISHTGKCTLLRLLLANFSGFALVYVCGLGYYFLLNYFYFSKVIELSALLITGFVVFIPTDLAFCVLTAVISKRIKHITNR